MMNRAKPKQLNTDLAPVDHLKDHVSRSLNSTKSPTNDRIKSMKEDMSRRKAPPVGQYNPKIEPIKNRDGKLTYYWKPEDHSKVAKQRKHKLKVMYNRRPVCGRILRTLNKKRKWMSPTEFKVLSPLEEKQLKKKRKESVIKSEEDIPNEKLAGSKRDMSLLDEDRSERRSLHESITNSLPISISNVTRNREQVLSSDAKDRVTRTRNFYSKTVQRNMQSTFRGKKEPEYYLVFKEYERFIERTQVQKTDLISNARVEFEKYSKRRPFVETPKDYSVKPNKNLSEKNSYYKPQLKKQLQMYLRDRPLWDPSKLFRISEYFIKFLLCM